MDPYIEDGGLWANFHDDLIAEIKRSLAARLPERYFVQTGERSYVGIVGVDEKEAEPIYPDVEIEKPALGDRDSKTGGAVAGAEPALDTSGVTMRAFIDEHFRENFIEIYEAAPGPTL